jgi:porin
VTGRRSTALATVAAGLLAGVSLVADDAHAQAMSAAAATASLSERPTLLGGPGSPEEWLRERGLGLDISLTQFGQAMISPSEGDNGLEYGGKLNAKLNFDMAKMGLWEGLSASALAEYKYGRSVNGLNGILLPINTQLYEPNGVHSALSLTFTQRFSKEFSLTAGKFNMVDTAAATPIVGGGGINTFWNLNFAAPPSGLVPPYITGLSATYRFEAVNATLMVYDPNDTQNVSGLDGWGKDGINTRLALQFPVKIAGLGGYQTLVGVYSTKDTIDLGDLPWLVLPERPPNTVIDVRSRRGMSAGTSSNTYGTVPATRRRAGGSSARRSSPTATRTRIDGSSTAA